MRRWPIAYTQHMQSAAPPVRVRSRAPLTQPHRRYIRCCVVRPRHARRHGRLMNLILMWSRRWRRWRRWRPTSPWRRRCDHARVYASREGAAAVSRWHRLRRASRRLQARARRTVASTSTRKAPASRSSTHGYVLTTSPRCGTRAYGDRVTSLRGAAIRAADDAVLRRVAQEIRLDLGENSDVPHQRRLLKRGEASRTPLE